MKDNDQKLLGFMLSYAIGSVCTVGAIAIKLLKLNDK